MPLPLAPGSVFVDALWHVRHDRSSAHQWLLQMLTETGGGAPGATPAPGL
jgi:hypothetical protein